MPAAPPPDVKAVYQSFPPAARKRLLAVRRLIFAAAAARDAGPLTETLKWGEPAYLTEQSKSGSTIRLGWKPKAPDQVALYFNCQTTLVDGFRTLYPELRFEGNRALLLDLSEPLPEAAVAHCVEQALTYHRDKRRR